MPYTHVVNNNVTYSAGSANTRAEFSYSQTAGAEANLSEEYTDATDSLTAWEMDVSQLKSIIMVATGGDITVETNDGVTPGDTISLTDGVPVIYTAADSSSTNPLTTDVTALYITNTGTATLKINALYDPTV